MPTQVIEERWEINVDDGDVTSTDPLGVAVALATRYTPLQVFNEFLVPVGVSLVFTAEDTFCLYLTYSSPGEAADGDPVDVVVVDSSRQNMRTLVQQLKYVNCQFVSNGSTYHPIEDQCHLDIAPGEQVIVREGERIQLRANVGAQTIDGSACYFRLTCKRIRHTLY